MSLLNFHEDVHVHVRVHVCMCNMRRDLPAIDSLAGDCTLTSVIGVTHAHVARHRFI